MAPTNLFASRFNSFFATIFLSLLLPGCAFIPDNFQFTEEVIDKEALAQVKRVALLDVPEPSGIWLGDPASGGALFFLGPLGAMGTATHEGEDVTSGSYFSRVTQEEMKNWLEQAGIEVDTLKAKRIKKAKMLKSYDQFKQVDADAILEVAPIRVGFIEDFSKFQLTEGELSPDVALTYRLITPENKVLIESNVYYSSFAGQYRSWVGKKTIGPKEHIFDGSEAVKQQPKEAARRLRHSVIGATELIAKTITNSFDELVFKPIDTTGDFSGIYISETTGPRTKYISKMSGVEITIVQIENQITGTFSDSGKIWGEVIDDTITFDWVTPGGNNGVGEWKISADGSKFEGTWITSTQTYGGTWDLKRIE